MAERKQIKVVLIRHTLNPEETIALGAKLCYSKSSISDLESKINTQDQSAFISKLMNMGHESVLEHASFTFGIEGVSRVLLAQVTRHRIASFSVQSQRYVSYEKGFGYILSNQDARFVLPNACETRILMTMNVRELRHFFSLRMCYRAQWEIREMATQMHRLCLETAPDLFADSGPSCLRGKCPEGEKSCGQQNTIRKTRRELLERIMEGK